MTEAAKEKKVKGTWGGARPNTGGARPGAGRKRLNGDIPTKQVQFRLTDAQAEALRGIMRRLHAGELKLEQLQELGGIDFTKR